MLSVLFNPNGRLAPRAFWRALILLLAAMIIVNVASAYAGLLGAVLGLLTLAAPYAYLCVFGKRLHDSGHSACWFLLFLLAYVILNGLLQTVLMPVLTPTAASLQAEMQLLMEQGQLAEAFSYAPAIQREGLLTVIITLLALNGGLGLIAARLPSEPVPNTYGPPTRPSSSPPSQ
ncbi:MAG: DUF805 domain-containing protein [Hyphomonadaceae bacterium]|nr:DUF805 domain-containing protein [Hyphomonadaceae bacterium]